MRSTKKEISTPSEFLLNLKGAYRDSGILPCEEILAVLVRKRNELCKLYPERQASERICYAGKICKERSARQYVLHCAPRYAGYAQAHMRTPAHLERNLSRLQFKCELGKKDYFEPYMRGVQFRAEHKKRDKHS